ncbi:hypothetical protein ZOSMA_3G01060 [Zostera marina]|uniref:Exocyst subunit Exo70 family protein n=1 Tax=Zostera marina TaxID=29655 RepID=A0A0K9P631_ZOSMR|nr:hypothetical protein ZOSMA_3G01060 [Zostera marina]
MAVNGTKIRRSLSTSVESIITKWDVAPATETSQAPDNSSFFKSIFYENRDDARLFLDAVSDLNSPLSSSDHSLTRRLLDTAAKRLQKEFYHILSTSRLRNREGDDDDGDGSNGGSEFSDYGDENHEHDRSGVDYSYYKEDVRYVIQSLGEEDRLPAVVAMADLKAIAESMASTGNTKECVNIYRTIRKSIVEQGMYNLGFKRFSQSHLRKLKSESISQLVDSWVAGSNSAIKALFSGERILCEYIFGNFSLQVKESCFADITIDSAFLFLQFPELIAATKRSGQNIYQLLQLYKSISELSPDIQSIFSYESTTTVRSQAARSYHNLADSIRALTWDLESSIEKHKFKGTDGVGGLDPLTVQTMNHLVRLSEYNTELSTIFTEESISSLITRLLLVLLCKIDTKSEKYKNVGLSYIFMANNVHYMKSLVMESDLAELVGDKWVVTQEKKVKLFTESYVKHGWRRVAESLAEEDLSKFNSEFLDAYRLQKNWVVNDQGRMRQQILAVVKKKVLIPYSVLYKKRTVDEDSHYDVVRFHPDDVDEYIEALLCGTVGKSKSKSSTGFGSKSGSSSKSAKAGWSGWRFLPG